MSAARRSLLTATAAGAVLGALWFVPSANATGDRPTEDGNGTRTSTSKVLHAKADTPSDTSSENSAGTAADTSASPSASASAFADQTRLADTGSFDTTPYVAGGTLFLGLGAGFVMYSVRRERTNFY